jgi:hypothetical protein
MRTIACPECHGAAAMAGGKAYCPSCHWNLDVAVASTHKYYRRLRWLGPLWFGIAILYSFGEDDTVAKVVPLVVITILFAFTWWKLRSDMRRVDAVRAGIVEPPRNIAAATAQQSAAVIQSEIAERDVQVLSSLPTPRDVRMKRRSKIGFGIVFVIFGALAVFFVLLIFMVREPGSSTQLTPGFVATMLVLVAFSTVIPFIIVGSTLKQKKLMIDGQFTLARITSQWTMRNVNGISYDFVDATGKLFKCRGNDPTRAFFEGMTVPVFYNPENPRKQIAACASAYEVVLPGQS